MDDYWPEDIAIDASFPPLVGTLGHLEMECAAALLVRALAARGRGWLPVPWSDVQAQLEQLPPRWRTNAFFRPDFAELVDEGFAIRVFDSYDRMELTKEAIVRFRRWRLR